MSFEFATAHRILFGYGRLRESVSLVASLGRRAFLVTGGGAEWADTFAGWLMGQGREVVRFPLSGEPTIPIVLEGIRAARETGCDLIIGFGGGSALDAGKAVAALIANSGELTDYLEVIGCGRPLENDSAPYVAIPTTAGTGSEVTRNAVMASPEHRIKVSLRGPQLLPRLAVVDPELTWSMPPAITASTGLDALTQLIEPFVGMRANPLTDALCREGILRIARSLRKACVDGRDAAAREDMSLASLFGGMALANASLGAVHGMAAPLGGMFSAPHGAVCARLLPLVAEANIAALRAGKAASVFLERYREVARMVTGNTEAVPEAGAEWLRDLCRDLSIPPLSAYGLDRSELPLVAAQSMKASSMKGNPVPLTEEQLIAILENAL